jgi:hypothetical protein
MPNVSDEGKIFIALTIVVNVLTIFFVIYEQRPVLSIFLQQLFLPCRNKLECLPVSVTSTLVQYLWAGLEAKHSVESCKGPHSGKL